MTESSINNGESLSTKSSVKVKLRHTNRLTMGVALAVTVLILLVNEAVTFRHLLVENLMVQANIVASNSTSALMFNNGKDAEEILSAFQRSPSVLSAAIYGNNDNIFAKYQRHTNTRYSLPNRTASDGYSFTIHSVSLFHGIVLNGKRIGTLYVESDLQAVYSHFLILCVTALLALGISFMIAGILLSRLQTAITVPIFDLAKLMSKVSSEENYAVRAHACGLDEVDTLAKGFNGMLAGIQQRDEELAMHKQHLEELVRVRTMDLENAKNRIEEELRERKRAQHEKKHLEAQLLQAQKMEAIGQLAGGVAHDFNNILQAVMGYSGLIQMNTKEELTRTYSGNILELSKKAAFLTQSLLAFSRKQVLQKHPVDINKIIINVQSILTRIIGEDIDLKVSLAQKNLITNVDAVQVEQVLMNLATNARDAMPDGGELLISTEQVQLDIKGYGERVTCACIKVSDTGQGMNEYTRQRVFDPFFTTKGVGKGTGLGLAMAFGIVEQHEGHINVDSEEGKGTTFSIYFPMAESDMSVTAHKSAEQRIQSGRGETVLLVEDDESVRIVTTTILEQHGYSVLQAVDGEDALSRVAEYNDRIKLIILDVIMPKKSGGEVYDEIMKMGLNVKILFTSGYPADTITKRGVLDTELHFIKKPTSSEELLRKIREVLDQ